MPALESEDEEHPQTDAPALAALRELLQSRSLGLMTRAVEVVRQRREEREHQHERGREGVQQQPGYVETIKRLVQDHVRQYLLRFEKIWHRNPGHPDIEERPELFQGWLRSLATKFENSAGQYERGYYRRTKCSTGAPRNSRVQIADSSQSRHPSSFCGRVPKSGSQWSSFG
jgi:hypothetical protein